MKWILALTAALMVSACGDGGSNKGADDIAVTVKDCEVWFVEDSSAVNQKRMKMFAASSAEVGIERAATAYYIAEKAIELTNYDFVDVFLVPKTAKRDRAELHAGTAMAWVRYAPKPEKIPFMNVAWDIQYKEGNTTKVINEYGNKEYEFESFIKLEKALTLDAADGLCVVEKLQ